MEGAEQAAGKASVVVVPAELMGGQPSWPGAKLGLKRKAITPLWRPLKSLHGRFPSGGFCRPFPPDL